MKLLRSFQSLSPEGARAADRQSRIRARHLECGGAFGAPLTDRIVHGHGTS